MTLILQVMQMIKHHAIENMDMEDVILKLQKSSKILFQWIRDNQVKANPEKCHFICG